MDLRFRWNMFITSFLPLWLAIIIADLYDMIRYVVCRWERLKTPLFDFWGAFRCFLTSNGLMIVSIAVILLLTAVSIWDLNRFLKQKESEGNHPAGVLKKVRRADKLSAEYLVAYILPMVAFDFSKMKGILLFLLYFGVLAFLCIRNSNVYINIYLELVKKYRMYKCDVECRVGDRTHVYEGSLVISRRDLLSRTGGEIRYWDFENYIYLDLETENEK